MAPTIELVEYSVALQNLRTLILDTCNLHNNFGLLHHCLRNTPNLEKLTLQYCKVLHFSISLILHNCSIYLVISNLLKSFMMEKGFRWFPWRGRQCQDKEGGVSKHGAFALSQARVYWTQIPWIWCQHSDTAKAFAGHLCTKEFNKVHQYEISVRDVLS